MRLALAAIILAVVMSGCVCTKTPVADQKWYEYQDGYMRDGYDGNMPWHFYPIVLPAYVLASLFV